MSVFTLWQPPARYALTGGYLYNHHMASQLRGRVRIREAEPEELDVLLAESPGLNILDSLYLWDKACVRSLGAFEEGSSLWRRTAWLMHSCPGWDGSRFALDPWVALPLSAAALRITPGLFMRDALREAGVSGAYAVCPPGVADSLRNLRRPPARKAIQLLTVANILPGKGYLETARALGGVSGLDWRWRIVGESGTSPETFAELLRALRALGLSSRVDVAGAVAPGDIAAEYAQADLFVLASRFENHSIAVAEAVAAGMPVLSTRVGDTPSWVHDRLNGLLVEPGETMEEELTDALGRVLSDEPLRLRLSRNASRQRAAVPLWTEAAGIFAQALGELSRGSQMLPASDSNLWRM